MKWIDVNNKLPEMGKPVFMLINSRMILGERCNPDGEGWLWCRIDETPVYRNGAWHYCSVCDDDYQPTVWMPLPEPPK